MILLHALYSKHSIERFTAADVIHMQCVDNEVSTKDIVESMAMPQADTQVVAVRMKLFISGINSFLGRRIFARRPSQKTSSSVNSLLPDSLGKYKLPWSRMIPRTLIPLTSSHVHLGSYRYVLATYILLLND